MIQTRTCRFASAALLLALAACAPSDAPSVAPAAPAAEKTVTSPYGMVVSGQPLASAVGARVLEEGGNAIDAAVATAFALAVVEPTMSGLGGRTQLLIRTADGAEHGYDGGTAVPAGYPPGTTPDDEAAYGYGTIGVPGTVAALATALERHGTWPLERILAPAIELAESGFDLPDDEAARIAGVADKLREFDGSRRYFLRPDGSPYAAGDRFLQHDLAAVLRAIAEGGARAFYTGPIAERMAADIAAHGGFVTETDLAGYAMPSSRVVRGSYRGYDIAGTYLPASGATTIEVLQILENFELHETAGSPEWAALLAYALRAAFDDRDADIADPRELADWTVSKQLARARARAIRADGAAITMRDAREPANTTHLSVADRDGAVVALTQSVGPILGSKVAAPGLGFVYAATMGYLGDLRPGDRPMSSQSPLIVTRDGRPAYVLGGAGARRIIPAIVAVLSRTIDQGLPFAEAMSAPRLHTTDAAVILEDRPGVSWTEADRGRLRALGFEVVTRADPPFFGRVNAIAFDPAGGRFIGVAETRWNGAAAAAPRH